MSIENILSLDLQQEWRTLVKNDSADARFGEMRQLDWKIFEQMCFEPWYTYNDLRLKLFTSREAFDPQEQIDKDLKTIEQAVTRCAPIVAKYTELRDAITAGLVLKKKNPLTQLTQLPEAQGTQPKTHVENYVQLALYLLYHERAVAYAKSKVYDKKLHELAENAAADGLLMTVKQHIYPNDEHYFTQHLQRNITQKIINFQRIKNPLQHFRGVISLDRKINNDSDGSALGDLIGRVDDDLLQHKDFAEALSVLLQGVARKPGTDMDKVLNSYCENIRQGMPHTQTELAEQLGMSQNAFSATLANAKKKLQANPYFQQKLARIADDNDTQIGR